VRPNQSHPGPMRSIRRGFRSRIPAITDTRAKGTITGLVRLTAEFGIGTGVARQYGHRKSDRPAVKPGRARSFRRLVARKYGSCERVSCDFGSEKKAQPSPLPLYPLLSSAARLNQGQAKAQVVAPVARPAPVPARRARAARVVAPPAAAVHPVRGRRRPRRIRSG
jgi:hypothetical protein